MDIQVLYIDPSTRRVSLKLGFKSVTGISKLLQIVVLSLLNVPGKDILDPELGGGLPELIGLNFDPTDTGEILSEVGRRIRKAETEIQTSQVGLNCPPDEKLQSIQVASITPGENLDEVLVRLRVINELGQRSDVVL